MPTKTKPRPKAQPRKAASKAKVAKTTNPHIEAGIPVNLYDGPSAFVNANRKPKIMLGKVLPPEKVTTRAQKALYALRQTYGKKPFQPRGFDNGILRDLNAAGLISLSGGQKQVIDGKEYLLDGAKPVQVSLTAAGLAYGKA